MMDIQEIESKFEELLLANPDFDESLLQKDEDGCYEDFDINSMYQMFEAGTEVGEKWQAAKAQAVPEGFVLVGIKDLREVISTASDAMMDENTSSVYEKTGKPSTWFDHYVVAESKVLKAIEAQEQSHDS